MYNCGSSMQNPVTIGEYVRLANIISSSVRFKDRVYPVSIKLEPSPFMYEVRKNLTERWPVALMSALLDLPFVNNPQLKGQVKQLQKVQNKLDGMTDLFKFFYSNEWRYDSLKLLNVLASLS